MVPFLSETLGPLAESLNRSSLLADVERVEVLSEGEFSLAIDYPWGRQWFRIGGEGVTELDPRADAALPFSSSLLVGGAAFEVVSYRPGRRLIARTQRRGEEVFLKAYRRRRSKGAVRRLRIAARACSAGGFLVPQVLEHRPDEEAYLMSRLPGERPSLGPESRERFLGIGAALRSLQEQEGGEGLPSFRPADELDVLREARRRCRGAAALPEQWEDELGRLETLAESLPVPRPGLCHRDLHDGQLLVSEAGTGLLDFDLLCMGDVALDPANLLAHLELRVLQGILGGDEESVSVLGEAVLEGLGRGADEDFRASVRFYQATSFLRLAAVYSLRPRWAGLGGALVDRARLCSRELERLFGEESP